jgi:maleate cis-trans isomerase
MNRPEPSSRIAAAPAARRDPRIGVLITASDAVVERDFARFLPRTASFHVARLMQPVDVQPGTIANMDGVIAYVPEALRALKVVEPDLLLFCCTSASFYRGPNWNRELDAQIAREMQRPAITTSTALLDGLHALHARRVLMVTPYPEHTNDKERAFLQAHGIDVVAVRAFDCPFSREIADIEPERILAEVVAFRAAAAQADAILISCTGLRSLEIAEEAERATGLPVVTSNMVTLWAALDHFRLGGETVPKTALFGKRAPARTELTPA